MPEDVNKIIIKDLKIYAYNGAAPEEQKLGQMFSLDLTIFTSFKDAVLKDSVQNALSYSDVIDFVKVKFLSKKFNLIESAAEFLCSSLLCKFNKIIKVTILLKKLNPPINANFSYVAVEISKSR